MAISKISKRLDDYVERMKKGRAAKIKAKHVEAALDKLKRRKRALQEELESVRKDEKRARLKRKVRVAREQIKRAKWLLEEVSEK